MNTKGKPLEITSSHSDVRFSTDRKVTVAEIEVLAGGIVFYATGSSWRTSGDKHIENKGQLIALYRAVEEMRDILKLEVDKLGD
jgi:hypothetical protein